MIRILLDRAFDNERHYIHAVGLSADTKPTTGIITGSKFIAVDTGAEYLFDETAGEWNEKPSGGGGSGMELVKSYTYDKKLIEDGVIQSIPSYSTSFQTLEASAEIEQLTCDFSNYFYFIFARGLAIPIYNTDTKGSGREEYSLVSFFGIPYNGPSNVPCISDPAKTFDQSTTGLSKGIETTCYVRWKNESEITADASSSYGVYQSFPNIQVTGNNLVVKSPNMYIRGNSNYLSSTYWSALTDIRCQYIIDVYKMPKPTASENLYKQYEHIFDCVRTNSHTLT